MTSWCLACLLAAAPPLFDVIPLPISESAAHVFLAPADGDRTADLFVQSGRHMLVHLGSGGEKQFDLPEGVSAFDAADIDGDGLAEVVAVRQRQVLAFTPFAADAAMSEPRVLFEADSLYAASAPEPYAQVLVKTLHQQTAVFLPGENTVKAYDLNGTLLQEFPNKPPGPKNPRYLPEFISLGDFGSFLDSRGDTDRAPTCTAVLEEIELVPDLPTELLTPGGQAHARWSKANPFGPTLDGSLNDSVGSQSDKYAGAWDQNVFTEEATQARYLLSRIDDSGNTLVFFRDVPLASGEPDWTTAKDGPVRRYPGRLLRRLRDFNGPKQRPDFNGDGYLDLVLWDAPRPGMSVDSIVRTVVGRTWPLSLSVHLYSPEKGRYEPKPAGIVNCKVPVGWFLHGEPPKHVCLADFNGEGETDLGFSTDEDNFKVWLFDDGFHPECDWTNTFPEPIAGIEVSEDLSGDGRTSLVLRGEKSLYLLRAR